MRVLMINSVCGIRSTGRICTELAAEYERQGADVKIAYGRENVPEQFSKYAVRIGNAWDVKLSALHTRITDHHGFANKNATRKFLQWADQYDPDVLWLHNLHGYYINIDLLFRWIKSRPAMEVKWTLHDCWAFTGHCSHFTIARCLQWQTGCRHCIQTRSYPQSFIADNCNCNFEDKKQLFRGVHNMTLITPSQWLADLVKQSFLKDYPVEVCHNTVDRTVFKPTESNFRERYGLENKKVILGVATTWSESKGLAFFLQLRTMLDENYAIVMVGLSSKQIKKFGKTIIAIPRTNSTTELAKMYTAADVFLNPSREETFGLTTIEALYCGTPAIVFQDTACEEVVQRFGGVAVPQDIEELYSAVLQYTK